MVGFDHPFREGSVVEDVGVVVEVLKDGAYVVKDGSTRRDWFGKRKRRRNEEERPRLLGGGSAVSSMTTLAKQGTKYEVEEGTDNGKKTEGGEETGYEKGGLILILDGASDPPVWRSAGILDVTDTAEKKHLLVKMNDDDCRVWLDLEKDGYRIKPYYKDWKQDENRKAILKQSNSRPEGIAQPSTFDVNTTTESHTDGLVPSCPPIELVGGLMVQVYNNPRQAWEKCIIENIDRVEDRVLISLLSGDQEEVELKQGEGCRLRSMHEGPVSLRGIVFTHPSCGRAASSSNIIENVREDDTGPQSKSFSISTGNDYYQQEGQEQNQDGDEQQGFYWSKNPFGKLDSPINRLKKNTTCSIATFTEEITAANAYDRPNSHVEVGTDDSDYTGWYYWNNQEAQQGGDALTFKEFRGWSMTFHQQLVGGVQGLANLGNTCFMNAVLQCLQHCGPLVQAILQFQFPTTRDPKHKLLTAFFQMLQRQWYSNGDSAFRPLLIKSLMSKIAPQFTGSRQHDAQEFLEFFLDALHEEVNRVKVKVYNEIKDDPNWTEQQLSDVWWNNYETANDSVMKDIFVGQIRSKVTCKTCEHVSTTFDPFWSLSIPFPATEGGKCLLEDCLRVFCEPENLDGENQYFCQKCKTFTDSTKQLVVFRCPKVLILHMKRFKGQPGQGRTNSGKPRVTLSSFAKISTPVEIPYDGLDIAPYCAESTVAAMAATGTTYSLTGVVNHLGASGAHGHYTADCFEPRTNTWYNYDDSAVRNTASFNEASAYVLFYVKDQ